MPKERISLNEVTLSIDQGLTYIAAARGSFVSISRLKNSNAVTKDNIQVLFDSVVTRDRCTALTWIRLDESSVSSRVSNCLVVGYASGHVRMFNEVKMRSLSCLRSSMEVCCLASCCFQCPFAKFITRSAFCPRGPSSATSPHIAAQITQTIA